MSASTSHVHGTYIKHGTYIMHGTIMYISMVLERSVETKTGHYVIGLLGAKCAPNLRLLGPQIFDISKHMRVFEVLKNPSKQLVHPPHLGACSLATHI